MSWWAIFERRRGEPRAERFCFGVEANNGTEAVRWAREIRARERVKAGLKPKRVRLEAKPWPHEEAQHAH